MKRGADWTSWALGAIAVYILWQWMQGAQQATANLQSTLNQANGQ
jgi:hypothetical protein